MKKSVSLKFPAAILLFITMTFLLSISAFAKPGWQKVGKRLVYIKVTEDGSEVRAKGLEKIGKYTYIFNRKGYLRTGWIKRKGKYYYFRPTGKAGKKGRMYTAGLRTFTNQGTYLFGEDGSVMSGLQKVSGKWYFFSTTAVPGQYGKMLKNKFARTEDGRKIFLMKNGCMAVRRWVKYKKKYYYMGADGNLVKNTTTPDGWIVNKKGVRTVKADAADSSDKKTGFRAAGTYKTTGKASILILCGHGQGDSGALGKWKGAWIQEQTYTRDFGKRVYNALKASGKVNVDLFNTSYDTYQQMRDTLNAVYVSGKTLQKRITGSGSYAKMTYNAVLKNKKLLDPLNYDYVLEIHFDASGTKDYSGNGRMKGTFVYVNQKKKNTKIDAAITNALHKLGLPVLGSAVWKSPGLLNARVYQEMGVSYGLLETCFIDDKDDMKFYFKKRNKMAKAVSNAIISYFS